MKRLYISYTDYYNNCQFGTFTMSRHIGERLRRTILKRVNYSYDVLGLKDKEITGGFIMHLLLFDELPFGEGQYFSDEIREKVIKSRPDKFGRSPEQLNRRI